MMQEIIALLIIIFFLSRLGWQFYHDEISRSQFLFWLIFWFIAGGLIIFIRSIDQVVARLGFSSTGIELLLYIAVATIFYWVFRLRLKMEKMEKNITELTRIAALSSAREKKD